MLEDRYLKGRHVYDRLMQELEKYGKLFIAFDFDNTVYDYHFRRYLSQSRRVVEKS